MKYPEDPREHSLPQEITKQLETFERLFQFNESPVLTIDVLANDDEGFEMVLSEIRSLFPTAKVVWKQNSQLTQAEECIVCLKDQEKPLQILVDKKTYPSATHDGYMHSHDQGLKDGRYRNEFNRLAKEHGTRLIIVRFCNKTVTSQAKAGMAQNDFRDLYLNVRE